MIEDSLLQLDRARLAQLGREYMLAAQFNSRTGYAGLRIAHGDEAYLKIAIDNWMAASPIYTRRMQRALRLDQGSDIATILKGMQLECGLSHQYFDAGFRELSDTEGEFWLNRCGALLETEPRGEAAVITMCHHIEDPTFDATAAATNPRARIRPIHRPPRQPAGREPHCHWRLVIDADAEPLPMPEAATILADTGLAQLEVSRPDDDGAGGMAYYDGSVFESLDLERFSRSALVVICKELAIQLQLLVTALGFAVRQQYGADAARAVTDFQMTGSCRVIAERLANWLDCRMGGVDGALQVLAVHPLLQPSEYVRWHVERLTGGGVKLCLASSIATAEAHDLGWIAALRRGDSAGLEALLQGVDTRLSLKPEGQCCWIIEAGDASEGELPLSVQVAMGTVLYKTRLNNRLQYIEVDV